MEESLFDKLINGEGNKILVMTEAFPFFIVGTLEEVGTSCISITAEFGVPAPLKGQLFNIQLEHISAFFVEQVLGEIPAI